MAVRPDRNASRNGATPHPAAETAPRPVTTTRRSDALRLLSIHQGTAVVLGERAGDKLREVSDRGEHALVHLVTLNPHPVLLLERHNQFEGVHRVEAEALPEQRRVIGDVFGRESLEVQALHDQSFQVRPESGVVEHG